MHIAWNRQLEESMRVMSHKFEQSLNHQFGILQGSFKEVLARVDRVEHTVATQTGEIEALKGKVEEGLGQCERKVAEQGRTLAKVQHEITEERKKSAEEYIIL